MAADQITDHMGLKLPNSKNEVVEDCESIAANFLKIDQKIKNLDFGIVAEPVVSVPNPNIQAYSSFIVTTETCFTSWTHVATEWQILNISNNKGLYSDISKKDLCSKIISGLSFILLEGETLGIRARHGIALNPNETNSDLIAWSGWSEIVPLNYTNTTS